jgi:hypothetical protein
MKNAVPLIVKAINFFKEYWVNVIALINRWLSWPCNMDTV